MWNILIQATFNNVACFIGRCNMSFLPINEELVELLYRYTMEDSNGRPKVSWTKIANMYKDIMREPLVRPNEQLRRIVKGRTQELYEMGKFKGSIEELQNVAFAPNKGQPRPIGYDQPQEEVAEISEIQVSKDGTQTVIAKVAMTADKIKSPEYVMEANGYPASEWEVIDYTVNQWTARNSDNEELINYQVKMRLKPRSEQGITKKDIENMVKAFHIEPRKVEPINLHAEKEDHLLSLFLTDLHFGNATYEDYEFHQRKLLAFISEAKREEIVFVIGSDMFHANNSKGETEYGTQVAFNLSKEQIFMDAAQFFLPLIDKAIECADRVKIIYMEGNHDKDLSYGFVYGLSWLYPQVEFDLSEEVRKAHVFHDVLIVYAHGHLPRNFKQATKVIIAEFKPLYSKAITTEIHSGHLHHQWSQEDIDIMMRGLSTANPTDKYHKDYGYVGARKVFQVFEYNHTGLKHQYYIGEL